MKVLIFLPRDIDFFSVFIGYNIGCKQSLAQNYILTNETQEISI